MSPPGIPSSLGALLIGTIISIFLSGVVSMQTVLYTSVYYQDPLKLRLMVYLIWLLDLLHTIFIGIADWNYMIVYFGDLDVGDWISWAIAVTVALTAIMTFVVQCFFAFRVYTVSRHKVYIAAPLALFALGRLAAALASTAMMIKLKSFSEFKHQVGWVFTLGLSLSASLDIMVAASLCYFLRKGKSGFASMDAVINTLTFWTIQNGLSTFVITVIALICWVSLSNLIFLTLHFIITKLYANAFLSTLNARRGLRLQHSSVDQYDPSLPVVLSSPDYSRDRSRTRSRHYGNPSTNDIPMTAKVRINVEETIQVDMDDEHRMRDDSLPSKLPL